MMMLGMGLHKKLLRSALNSADQCCLYRRSCFLMELTFWGKRSGVEKTETIRRGDVWRSYCSNERDVKGTILETVSSEDEQKKLGKENDEPSGGRR